MNRDDAVTAGPASARGERRMPALFVGHGSPMNALEDNAYTREWAAIAASLPRPRAILCISAHWETAGVRVTAMERPRTIHDFSGFPRALAEFRYPAPGSLALAERIRMLLPEEGVQLDSEWGLDHGAWSVLCRMFPQADIPVVQLSLDRARDPASHFALGAGLKPLRAEGVLIVGSGNIVHNLKTIVWQDVAFVWARQFDAAIAQRISACDFGAVIHYDLLGLEAGLAVPTTEHFLPLLYVLGLADPEDAIEFFCQDVTLGSISMRSVKVG